MQSILFLLFSFRNSVACAQEYHWVHYSGFRILADASWRGSKCRAIAAVPLRQVQHAVPAYTTQLKPSTLDSGSDTAVNDACLCVGGCLPLLPENHAVKSLSRPGAGCSGESTASDCSSKDDGPPSAVSNAATPWPFMQQFFTKASRL